MKVGALDGFETFAVSPDPVIRTASWVYSLNNITIIYPFSKACHHKTLEHLVGHIRDIHVEQGATEGMAVP